MSLSQILTWNLKVGPFLVRTTESVQVLQEVTAAGHKELITSFLCVTARVELHRQEDGSRDVHLILRQQKQWHWVNQENAIEIQRFGVKENAIHTSKLVLLS